jgi:SAM-dependent methyltransferase
MDLLKHNREAWNRQVAEGNIWTRPVDTKQVEEAKRGNWNLVLTPTKSVPGEWFPDLNGKKVLCLASGGGQQGPILAAAGAEVVVFDNSPAQLGQDRMVADREGLLLTTEQGDMRDLSRFKNEEFDLIFHPVSNCFIDDIKTVWKECYRVLKMGGSLLAGFCNPLTFIFDFEEWDKGNLVVKYRIPFSDMEQLPKDQLKKRIESNDTLEFGHSLADQIGGQISAGFMINGFYEDSSGKDLLDPHIDTFIATRAIKFK